MQEQKPEPTSTRIPIEFGEIAVLIRKMAREQGTTVSKLVAGMVAVHFQE